MRRQGEKGVNNFGRGVGHEGFRFPNTSFVLYRLFRAALFIAGVRTQAGALIKGNSIAANPKQAKVKHRGC